MSTRPPRATVASPAAQNRRLLSPRLSRLASARERESAPDPEERCELCGEPMPSEHRHLLDLQGRQLLCACRACSVLFDRGAAGGGHYRLVPQRRLALDSELPDHAWEQLRIPVEMAFFFRSSTGGRVHAFYPSPAGATESRLELEAWQDVESALPALASMDPDVEALLVNRARGARRQWIVPIDDCYRLVALIRTRWRGFTGGKEVWLELDRFFSRLDQQSNERSRRDQAR